MIRTSLTPERIDPAGRGHRLQRPGNTSNGTSGTSKPIDLDLRPIYHHLEDRVRAHVFICMLAGYLGLALAKHGRRYLHRRGAARAGRPRRPGSAARRPPEDKALRPARPRPVQPLHAASAALLEHLATLTRNQVRYTGTDVTLAMLAEPTSTQRQAFELIGAPIPLTLK